MIYQKSMGLPGREREKPRRENIWLAWKCLNNSYIQPRGGGGGGSEDFLREFTSAGIARNGKPIGHGPNRGFPSTLFFSGHACDCAGRLYGRACVGTSPFWPLG